MLTIRTLYGRIPILSGGPAAYWEAYRLRLAGYGVGLAGWAPVRMGVDPGAEWRRVLDDWSAAGGDLADLRERTRAWAEVCCGIVAEDDTDERGEVVYELPVEGITVDTRPRLLPYRVGGDG